MDTVDQCGCNLLGDFHSKHKKVTKEIKPFATKPNNMQNMHWHLKELDDN